MFSSVPDKGRFLFQEVKRVICDTLHGDSVQRYGVHSILGNVHGRYLRGTGKGAGQGETALVAEAVQHAASAGEASHGGIIVKLVQIQAGFLSRLKVNHELHAAAACGKRFRLLSSCHPDGGGNTFCRQHG